MADRAAKRLRRVSTEYEDSDGGDRWTNRGSNSAAQTASSTRPRRGTANQSPAAAVIQRSSPEETRQSIRLTVKSSPGRLREATSGAVPKTRVSRQNIVSGKRTSRSSRVVREVDSEEDEEEDDDDEEPEEVDAMDVDEDEDEEDDVDAEGDEDDDMDAEGDEDEDMDEDTPVPRPVIPTSRNIPVKPAISITKPQDSVEAKEMAMDVSDDDELSDLDSDMDEDDAEGEDEDAEGDEDDDMAAQNDDEEVDSDVDLSRDQTPDMSKMTKRQRAMVNEDDDGALLALSNEAQKKKHLTAEEHAMRRAEMARRRKNLSEKRNEEEKLDTINRLLKKQPPKRGRRAIQDITESGQEDEPDVERANPLFVRYVQNAKGTHMGVPDEWLQAPIGSLFAGSVQPPSKSPFSGRMVQEVA
ncbi:uncharacterized protein K460DRAFT_362902 [Cucurbitaria berberidis CBS 394.84]|uniref:INO80 complex subunit B-like conserved region domain-containing protein n=1 Tax=Cucurbitaria berberidis CBS 394.84 TaxID=1168544 RepID=A0A9P4GUQ6_9PLEO|nr:uncharacterized protein K460DRAFT_362902 [Cucurbitaria berberidis CBS 394.84]KAF1852135.1 hypothetical protein K460DRAFT_362902 [Cucurbitaria berberidis CBS 394.84]